MKKLYQAILVLLSMGVNPLKWSDVYAKGRKTKSDARI